MQRGKSGVDAKSRYSRTLLASLVVYPRKLHFRAKHLFNLLLLSQNNATRSPKPHHQPSLPPPPQLPKHPHRLPSAYNGTKLPQEAQDRGQGSGHQDEERPERQQRYALSQHVQSLHTTHVPTQTTAVGGHQRPRQPLNSSRMKRSAPGSLPPLPQRCAWPLTIDRACHLQWKGCHKSA